MINLREVVKNGSKKFLIGVIITLLAIVYAWLIASSFNPGNMKSFGSLDGVMKLFQNKTLLTAGWVHYLAFDLMVGTWIKRNSLKYGIRLGIVFFIIFSLEEGLMAAKFSHTVGSPDGGPGLPFINWSTQYGDLRIAHFLGIHSLQLLPLLGYYIAKSKKQIIGLSVIYFIIVMAVFIQALSGRPLLF